VSSWPGPSPGADGGTDITKDEIQRTLGDSAIANGFANRFVFVCAKRSKLLPEGGNILKLDWPPMIRDLSAAVRFGRTAGCIERDQAAKQLWAQVYPELSEGKLGLFGAVTARAEAQVMRLACLYALLDSSSYIGIEHLRAGLEVWRYCEDSARFIFGDATGDPTGDEILGALRGSELGMTRNELRDHFQRHKSSGEIGRALALLSEHGLVRSEREETGGRPVERWFSTLCAR
jgi:hypothetical protein